MKLVSLAFLVSVAALAQPPRVDFEKQKAEILDRYRTLIRLDTSSPPGNETIAVEYLKKVLEAEGIPTETFAQDPKRANLVARLKGNGTKKPLLMTMLLLKRSGAVLDRDVIFLAESGEEADPTGVGINFMVAQHFPKIEAEFAITEGGGATLDGGKLIALNIGTAEKVPARVRLVSNGTSGHGSVPRQDNALTHLAGAVQKVGTWQTPMRLNETTRTYFEKLATMSTPEKAAVYNGLLNPATAEASQRYLMENEPSRYSMLRTSVVPTMLKAGVGPNVIPSEAEATLDIRALPDENIPAFYEEMKRIIGDPAVKIVPMVMTRPFSPASPLGSEAYRTLERVAKRMYPGATILPSMSTGASDMAQLRAKGIPSYGIGPASTESDRINYGAHSDVERLLESSLYQFVEFTWNAVTELSVHR